MSVFQIFLKLYKWYQIAQSVSHSSYNFLPSNQTSTIKLFLIKFLFPLKTSKNIWFSDNFWEAKRCNGLNWAKLHSCLLGIIRLNNTPPIHLYNNLPKTDPTMLFEFYICIFPIVLIFPFEKQKIWKIWGTCILKWFYI